MGFPPAGFPGTGPTPGSAALDQPPPSPTPMGGPPPGAAGPGGFSMRGLAGQIPSGGMPPEVLTGITQSAQSVSDLLDSWSQITPDQASQLSMIKDLIQQYLAGLMTNGAGATAPTAAGPAPPMGGMDRGLSGAGAI
jgi:hypothetical protein